MKQVIVLSGVSGSGKSTLAQKLTEKNGVILSADFYFMVAGKYKFDAHKLGAAHSSCFRNYIESLRANIPLVVVDNTNTTEAEIAPYMLGAAAFGFEAKIVTVRCARVVDVEFCATRNSHNVPLQSVMAQHIRISNRKLPPYWNREDRIVTVP